LQLEKSYLQVFSVYLLISKCCFLLTGIDNKCNDIVTPVIASPVACSSGQIKPKKKRKNSDVGISDENIIL
jgi:hypothetical protein